jgi:peptide/nickel transport system substrate-binding protein
MKRFVVALALVCGLSLLLWRLSPYRALPTAAAAQRPDDVAAVRSLPPTSDAGRKSLRGGTTETPRRGGTLVQYVPAEYGTLNNITRGNYYEEAFCRLFLFPPLLDLDPDTLELVPTLAAEHPRLSDDRLTYTWKIRPGVRWQRGLPDGTPVEVTTDDVEFSWRMLSDEKVPAIAARGALSLVKSIEKVDRYTFTVVMKSPYFKTELEFGTNFRLMPAHLCEHDPAKFAADPLGRAPVGYGPYKFAKWQPKEYVELERNPDWFGAASQPYYVERMRMRFIADVSQIPDLFQQGQISIGTVNDTTRWEQMKKDPAWAELGTFHEYYLTQCVFVAWNCTRAPFDDARVRRAMTLLFPREQVRDAKYLGHAFILSSPFSVGAAERDPNLAPLPFDPERAAKLLAEAGFADHDGDGTLDKDGRPFRFVLSTPTTVPPALEAANNWFQEKLHRAGIEMTLRATELKQLVGDLPQHLFDAAEVSWNGDPRDDDLYERFHSDSADHGRNYSGYRNAEFDRLITAWRGEFDRDKRLELSHQMERRLAEDQPVTFLFNPQSLVIVSTKFRNVQMHRLGARWFDWWLSE